MDPGPPAPKIEIFAPFEAALDLTRLILFQPFDLGKWFTIGFAAFLSHLSGGGFSFNYNRRFGSGDWKWTMHSATQDAFGSHDGMALWLVPLLLLLGIMLLALFVLFMWLGARGKFIFTDCIVRNRGAIVEPWHEFKREGNSYFLFSLLVAFLVICLLALAGTPLWLPFLFGAGPPEGLTLVLGLSFLGLVLFATALAVALASTFMIPVMYRRRCRAPEAFRAAISAMTANLGPVILYVLFMIVLFIAVALISCLTTCLTCCITAIPYIGTVILLPLYVFLMSYLLLFVRQFGNDYDAWANLLAAAPVVPIPSQIPPGEPPSPEPPPVQI